MQPFFFFSPNMTKTPQVLLLSEFIFSCKEVETLWTNSEIQENFIHLSHKGSITENIICSPLYHSTSQQMLLSIAYK